MFSNKLLLSNEKIPYVLALKLDYIAIYQYRALHLKKINIVLKWQRKSSPLKKSRQTKERSKKLSDQEFLDFINCENFQIVNQVEQFRNVCGLKFILYSQLPNLGVFYVDSMIGLVHTSGRNRQNSLWFLSLRV